MALPGFLKQVASQVQSLVATPQHLEHWRSTISAWAKSDEVQQRYETVTTTCCVDDELKTVENEYSIEPSPLVPLRPSLGYEYALLAAASNAVASDTEDSTAIIIDPFSQDSVKTIKGKPEVVERIVNRLTPEQKADTEGVARSGPFTLLKIRIQNGDISEADVERLNEFLGNIHSDLKANAAVPLPPVGASQSGTAEIIPEDPGEEVPAKVNSSLGFLGGEQLRIKLGVHETQANAFEQQLGRMREGRQMRKGRRMRKVLGDDNWHEVTDPRPNSPKFLYRADATEIQSLAKPYVNQKPA